MILTKLKPAGKIETVITTNPQDCLYFTSPAGQSQI